MLLLFTLFVHGAVAATAGFTCGTGTVPDVASMTCMVDPAILARTARAETNNEVINY